MKLPLTKEIEDSAKGIDYVNSLVPTNSDVIGAVIEQIKDSEYLPNYVKYHDGEKWVEVWNKNPQSAKTVLTKQQMIDLGISNNIPKLSRKFKRQQNHFAMFVFVCMALGIILYVALIIYLILEKL